MSFNCERIGNNFVCQKFCTSILVAQTPCGLLKNNPCMYYNNDKNKYIIDIQCWYKNQICPITSSQTHGTPTDEKFTYYEPKAIRSAPVTPCDSESTWSSSWSRQYDLPGYDTGYDDKVSNDDIHDLSYHKNSYESDGVWWWRRPLGVRRMQCRRCGASSTTRPLRMTPCVGTSQDDLEEDRRPLRSRDRPLNFVKQLFL